MGEKGSGRIWNGERSPRLPGPVGVPGPSVGASAPRCGRGGAGGDRLGRAAAAEDAEDDLGPGAEHDVDAVAVDDDLGRAVEERGDARHLERFSERFPTIAAALERVGLDPATDLLPIAPAAHYHCGGILTDLDGAASLPGLWAAGEVAASGVHGANRLASNSLLDGMVFGFRCVEAIEAGAEGPSPTGAMRAVLVGEGERSGLPGRRVDRPILPIDVPDLATDATVEADAAELRTRLQSTLTRHAGVVRSGESLRRAAADVAQVADALARSGRGSTEHLELRNLVEVGAALVRSAEARTESRGCHTRSDTPETSDDMLVRFVLGGVAEG